MNTLARSKPAPLKPTTFLDVAERLGRIPGIVALGGWSKPGKDGPIGAGYFGDVVQQNRIRFFGKEVDYFSSSHDRSHIMMAVGMAPPGSHDLTTVLVWEGITGAFYVVDRKWRVVRTVPVLNSPGNRYALLFSLADPTFADRGHTTRPDVSGKLMALAAYGDAATATSRDVWDDLYPVETVEAKKRLLPQAAREDWTCLFYHDPEQPLARNRGRGREVPSGSS